MSASTPFWMAAVSGPVRAMVPASLSMAAVTPLALDTAFSAPTTQLLQQRWTSESLTVLSATAKGARARVVRRARVDLFMGGVIWPDGACTTGRGGRTL